MVNSFYQSELRDDCKKHMIIFNYVDQYVSLPTHQLWVYIKQSPTHFECMFIVQERVEALNEKLDLVLSGGEKLTDGEISAEGGPIKPGYGKKPCKLPVDRLWINEWMNEWMNEWASKCEWMNECMNQSIN